MRTSYFVFLRIFLLIFVLLEMLVSKKILCFLDVRDLLNP